MSLGSYPQISLKEARGRRDEARALVAQGINPYEHRKQQRRSVRNARQSYDAVLVVAETALTLVWSSNGGSRMKVMDLSRLLFLESDEFILTSRHLYHFSDQHQPPLLISVSEQLAEGAGPASVRVFAFYPRLIDSIYCSMLF